MFIQVFFIEAQAGVSFQFYDDAGALLGVPVSVGVEALPQVLSVYRCAPEFCL